MTSKATKKKAKSRVAKEERNVHGSPVSEKPKPGYIDRSTISQGVKALRMCLRRLEVSDDGKRKKPKSLLEAGDEHPGKSQKVLLDVVFKNIPSNNKTYIHNVVLPHHWRLELEPEHYDIAVFVPHKKPQNEVEKIQFSKDRDLDIENTHAHYQNLFLEKLDEATRARISRVITSKELATEFNTFQKIDRLSKTFDLFLSDKKLMANKLNALPRRLGRRFWVREKKVPLIIKLEADNLNERFNKILSTEPFYVVGKSSTERIQLGLMRQEDSKIVENIEVFLKRLFDLYGDNVRFIRLRSSSGMAIPLYADLAADCPKEVKMNKKKIQPKPVVGDFDLLPGNAQIKVHASGTVRVIRPGSNLKRKLQDSPVDVKPAKKVKGK